MLILASLCLLVTATSSAPVEYDAVLKLKWKEWMSLHGKQYSHEKEELERSLTWMKNMKYIESHNSNAAIHGFTLAMNEYGDLVC